MFRDDKDYEIYILTNEGILQEKEGGREEGKKEVKAHQIN